MNGKRPVLIYFCYQTDSEVPYTSIYSAVLSIPITFRLFRDTTSEMLDGLLAVFTLLLWQRQNIIVVDVVDYKYL
jgi:hypothetical protein